MRTPFARTAWPDVRATFARRLAALTALLTAAAIPASALTIDATFESSVTSLSDAAQVESAFNYAAQQYEALFTNPIVADWDGARDYVDRLA